MQTYKILLIDDEKEYCESLKTNAYQIGVDEFDIDMNVTDCQNWQDGAEHLNNNYFHALILDAKCMVDREQETENFGFLPTVMDKLKDIEQKQNRHIPFAVNTGYLGEKETQIMERLINERKSKIFSKSSPKKDLIVYLFEEIEKAPTTKIEREYNDVFEIFDEGYLEIRFKGKLLEILKNRNEEHQTTSILQDVRVIQDEIYNVLNRKDSSIVPNGSFTQRNKHLSGNTDRYFNPTTAVYQTNTISYLANAIYRISSDFGSHPPQRPNDVSVVYWEMPSKYAVKSLVFGLLEQLVWFKCLMDDN